MATLPLPTDKELLEFSALKTHDEKCQYFADHPSLARVYRQDFFEKPAAALPAIDTEPKPDN